MKLKTILLSLVLLLITSAFAGNGDICIFSSDVENKDVLYYLTGQDNPFTGTSKCVYSDTGQIKSLGEIRDGKRDGKYTWWHENGQIKSEVNYKDGKQDGKWTTWHENGWIMSELNYKDGKLRGKWTTWHENGQKKMEAYYKDDKQDGKWTVWYENGQKKSQENYKNGSLVGEWTWWYEDGQIEFKGNYKDSKPDGKWTWWYEDGQIEEEGNYINGRLDGKWTVWYENGQLWYEDNYTNGKKDFKWPMWVWFVPFALILVYSIRIIKGHRTSGKKTSEGSHVTDKLGVPVKTPKHRIKRHYQRIKGHYRAALMEVDEQRMKRHHTSSKKTSEGSHVTDELGLPVKTPKHDESKIKVGDVLLGGLLVGSLTCLLYLSAFAIQANGLALFFPVVALGVKWVWHLKGRKQSLVNLLSVNLVAFLVIAVLSYRAVFGAPSGAALFGYYMSATAVVWVSMIGAIVGVVASLPYVIYLSFKNK